MAIIKFMTICDDVISPDNREFLKRCDISVYPSMYFCRNNPFIDTVNTDSETFYNDFKAGKVTVMPTVPADVFEYEFRQAYNLGYLGVIAVFPHNKWTDFKHQAEIAKKRFLRKEKIDELGFVIKFIDSKTFAGGTSALVYNLALFNKDSHLCVDDFYNIIKSEKYDKFTYILSRDENVFDSDKGLKGYIIKNDKVTRMNISHYSESVIFDLFTSSFLKNSKDCKYNISLGYNCDFAGNIIGRIIKSKNESVPERIIKYGVPTTCLLGNAAICINFVKKKGLHG